MSVACYGAILYPIIPQGNWTNGVTSYVTTTGNDSTFVRGNIAFPAATVNYAVSNMLVGDTLSIGAGNFNVTNMVAQPRNSVIVGSGKSATILTNWFISTPLMAPADNSTIKDLTVWGRFGPFAPAWGGQFTTPFTNALLQRVGISNQIDCLFVETDAACNAQIDQCVFESRWDIAVLRMFPLGTSNPKPTLRIYNTTILVRTGTISWGGLDLQGNGTLMELYQCNITTELPLRFAALTDGSRVNFISCVFTWPLPIVPGYSAFVDEINYGPYATNNVVAVYNCDIPDILVQVQSGQGILRFNSPNYLGRVTGLVVTRGNVVIR